MFFNCFGQFNYMNFGYNNFYNPSNWHMPELNFMPIFQFQPFTNNFWNNTSIPSYNIDTFVRSNTNPLQNYNSAKGNTLANIAMNRTVGETGYCAKFVQEAISLSGLGNCTGANAYQMTDTLRVNPNFKEITSKNIDVSTLPAGCVLVYDKYVRNDTEDYGHTEITTGDGGGVSDCFSNYINPNPTSIFMPV